MRKRTKYFIIGLALGLAIALISSAGIYLYFGQNKLNETVKNYEMLIDEIKVPPTIKAYRLVNTVKQYQVLSASDYEMIEIPAAIASDALASKDLEISGLSINGNYEVGTILHDYMLYAAAEMPADLRVYEIANLITPTYLKTGNDVDIRISFPSGLDYIVLPKKRLMDLMVTGEGEHAREMCIFYLNQDEILRLSSAMVDAYLHKGTYLYTTQYVSSENQIAATSTYPANEAVQALIKEDPNIIEKASIALEENKRQALQESLNSLPDNSVRTVPEDALTDESKQDQSIQSPDSLTESVGE